MAVTPSSEVTCRHCGAGNPPHRRACRRCRRVLRPLTPEQCAASNRLGAYARWARERDGTLATAPARANGPASLDYWAARVDPDEVMSPRDRMRAAASAKRDYYARLGRMGRDARRAS